MLKEIVDMCHVIRHLVLCSNERFMNPFKNFYVKSNRILYVLANGPSLNTFLESYSLANERNELCDFIAVNDFIINELSQIIRPVYYVLSDAMFFYETKLKERGLKVLNELATKVSWPMILFVGYEKRKSTFIDIIRKNPNIHIVFYHSFLFPIDNDFVWARRLIFKHGLGCGDYSTVALSAIYIAITLRYKTILLYGVDHTFFDGLTVNENNIPCYIYKHSFDLKEKVRPMENHYVSVVGQYKTMTYFIREMYHIFKGHVLMADYAEYMGANIINCTENSLIDAYPRKK